MLLRGEEQRAAGAVAVVLHHRPGPLLRAGLVVQHVRGVVMEGHGVQGQAVPSLRRSAIVFPVHQEGFQVLRALFHSDADADGVPGGKSVVLVHVAVGGGVADLGRLVALVVLFLGAGGGKEQAGEDYYGQ